MPAIRLPSGDKRRIEAHKNLVYSQRIQHEYTEWFKLTKPKQLDALAKRLTNRTKKFIAENVKTNSGEVRAQIEKEGLAKVTASRVKIVDEYILSNLHISPEKRVAASRVLADEQGLSTYFGFATVKHLVSKKPFVELAQKVLLKYDQLSEHRKEDLARDGFVLEKTKDKLDKLARSGAKNYLPEFELVRALKQLNSTYLGQVIGPEAAYVYYEVYGKVKWSLPQSIMR